MSTLQKIGNLRPKNKPTVKVTTPVSPPIQELAPGGLQAYIETPKYELVNNAIATADKKIVQEVRQKILKIKIKRNGAVNTMAEVIGCPPGSAHYALFEEYDQLMEQEEFGARLSAQETVALFVTLSPEPGSATPQQIYDAMEKISTKKGIVQMLWSIENFGTASEHPHSHAVIILDKTTPSGERGKMKSTVTRICKPFKTKSEAYLDVKSVSVKSLPKKIAYVKGQKDDKAKAAQVEKDKVWRKEIGLEDWYVFPNEELPHDD